jgi:hypothetical protein
MRIYSVGVWTFVQIAAGDVDTDIAKEKGGRMKQNNSWVIMTYCGSMKLVLVDDMMSQN